MLYGPHFDYDSDEEGFSDDNEYYEFKKRLRNQHLQAFRNKIKSEEELRKLQFQKIFTAINYQKEEEIFSELDKGVKIDEDLDCGWTPLLLASTVGNLRIIKELISRGANINQVRDGFTSLMLLCNINNCLEGGIKDILSCVKYLAEGGADVNAMDRKRKTAIMFAAYNGHLEIVKFLLPLVDKESTDNKRWTALFWAVDGNKADVVELLLKEDFSYDITDVFGDTIADIAHHKGFENISKLLPQEPCNDDFSKYLNHAPNFEETFLNLKPNEKPRFFSDMCKILHGCRSESVIPILDQAQLGIYELLSINCASLKDLGVKLPFQRYRILKGLYTLHKHPFQPKSVPFVRKNEMFTNIDVGSIVLSCIKQLIMMDAGLKFIMNNYEGQLKENSDLVVSLKKNKLQIRRLKAVSIQLIRESVKWDLTLKAADKITRKRRNIPWGHLCVSIALLSSALTVWFKAK